MSSKEKNKGFQIINGHMKKILIALMAVLSVSFVTAQDNPVKPRYRVILDNDYAGDPDGLVQLAHQLMSPSTEIRAIIGSGDIPSFPPTPDPCGAAVDEINKLMTLMGIQDKYPVLRGSNEKMTTESPADCEGARAIIKEALRTDTKVPLLVLCGGSLKTVASAWLIEPAIADKLTVIWIGGQEYDGSVGTKETNLNLSIAAAEVIFNKSTIPLWQIPRDVYRQAMMSTAEMKTRVAVTGKAGSYLTNKVLGFVNLIAPVLGTAETYVLGDSPLVLLTALQTCFQPDPSSSFSVIRKAPKITGDGKYEDNPEGRPIRVFTQIDSRLMFEDFIAKLVLLNSSK